MDDRPIGMFDSGVGGLTVARAVIDVCPGEHLLYLGDTARGPYGPRPLDEVRDFAFEICDWLVAEGVKLVVIACNTAAAAALELLRAEFRIPIIGVIEPGVRAALKATDGGRIGMVGTVGTVSSKAYDEALARLRPGAELVSAPCPGFVEFVERGETGGAAIAALADAHTAPLRAAGIDTLILGCTHYPLLARVISDAVGRDVMLLSSADETAFEVADILARTGTGRRATTPGRHRFGCTGDADMFKQLGERFLGPEVRSVESVVLGGSATGDPARDPFAAPWLAAGEADGEVDGEPDGDVR